MKKLLLFLCLSAACLPTLSAAPVPQQGNGKNINVTDTEVVRVDATTVSVAFKLEAGGEVTAQNRSLVVRPSLVGTKGRSELPPIIIRGGRARAAAEDKAMAAAGVNPEGRYMAVNGSVTEYYAQIPWQTWMTGSRLELSGLNAGRGDATEVTIGMVADGLLYTPALAYTPPATQAPVQAPTPVAQAPVKVPAPEVQVPVKAPAPEVQAPVQAPTPAVQAPARSTAPVANAPGVRQAQDHGEVVQRSISTEAASMRDYSPADGYYNIPARNSSGSIGDELAARFTFVEPVAKFNRARSETSIEAVFDYNMPLVYGTPTLQNEGEDIRRFVEMTREGAVYFRFERGSYIMERALGENNKMHVDLISSIRLIDGSPDTRVSRIVVVGFSAPEGALDEKETLAMERAVMTRDFLTANSNVSPDLISIYNGSVDWATLRALVAQSNMPEKYKVLEIIDNVKAWNSSRKQSRMGRLMALNDGEVFAYMRQHFFPLLRQTGAYAKVYYENVR